MGGSARGSSSAAEPHAVNDAVFEHREAIDGVTHEVVGLLLGEVVLPVEDVAGLLEVVLEEDTGGGPLVVPLNATLAVC